MTSSLTFSGQTDGIVTPAATQALFKDRWIPLFASLTGEGSWILPLALVWIDAAQVPPVSEGTAQDTMHKLPVHALQHVCDAAQRLSQVRPQTVLQQREAQVPQGGAHHLDDSRIAEAHGSLQRHLQSLCHVQLGLHNTQ